MNQNFTSIDVLNNEDRVVLDSDAPKDGDIAQDWTFDVRARGAVSNEWGGDLPGSALVYIEWARLMLEDISKLTGQPMTRLGDPRCIGFDANGVPNYESQPHWLCSGIEGLIIPSTGPDDDSGDGLDFSQDPSCVAPTGSAATCLDAPTNYDSDNFYASVLKPGDVIGPLCVDANNLGDCTFDTARSIWGNILEHVTRVMGNGQVNNLPFELRDRKYYFKWFGLAFVKYLKAYGAHDPTTRDSFPKTAGGGGVGPTEVKNTLLDNEAFFFDYLAQTGTGGAQTFDKFEYVDRDFIGKGTRDAPKGNNLGNMAPWDFEYGSDLYGGNQRYDNYFRRMDREEIAMYSAMLTDKTKSPGAENNVNITNLFGSVMLGGDASANIAGTWPNYKCAIGAAGAWAPDPANPGKFIDPCGGKNPPLDPDSTLPKCGASGGGACAVGTTCINAVSYERGVIGRCAAACDYTAYPQTGCAANYQACVKNKGCMDLMMDQNAHQPNAHALLYYYPSAWTRTPFSRGHSPIVLPAANKRPQLGVAKALIPNFAGGPYTNSPLAPDTTDPKNPTCPTGYTFNLLQDPSKTGAVCNAAVNNGTGTSAAYFSALTPWLEVQPGVGFRIPLDGQRDQQVVSGQLDYTGVLESYIVDYVPYVDKAKPSCVGDGTCHTGFACDPASHDCVTTDDTVRILAIEGTDFLGEAFVCKDPGTGDILHVRMYESATAIIDWLAQHPGDSFDSSAQDACQIIIRRSPYDNYIDSITTKANGVDLNVSGGQGLGRVTDIVLYDTGLIQAL